MKGGGSKQEESAPISDFNGHYQFLNNDHPAWVLLDGELYPSVSIAYQASRTSSSSVRQQLQQVQTYQKFKQIALEINNPSDWNHRKERVMERLVRDKFKRSKELAGKLAATHPRPLVNTFKSGGENEHFWGVIDGKGSNVLGKMLMGVREQIRKGIDWQKWVSDQGLEANLKLQPSVALVVIKDSKPIDKLFLQKKNKLFFGSSDKIDFKLDHPSISKMHACIYFAEDQNVMLVDLCSSNGTSLTREGKVVKLQHLRSVNLQAGDMITFGLSSRTYRVDIDDLAVKTYLKSKEEQRNRQTPLQKNKDRERNKNSRSRSRSRSQKRRKSKNN